MIRVFRILLLLLGTSQFGYGVNRYFTWVDPQTKLRIRIDLDNYELYKEDDSNHWLNQGKIQLDTNIFNHLPQFVDNNFFFYDNGNRIRITIQGTGQVYEYLPLKKELIRIDKTFHSGFNFGSNLFVRNNTLYSVGGEGFWNYSPTITYFDEKTKEWEILRPKNEGPIPMVDGYQGYYSKGDVYYSGGSGLKNYLEEENIEYIDDLYLFDFKQNQWSYLGKINPDLPFKKSRGIIWTGEFFIHFSGSNIYIINPNKNEVHLYKNNKKVFKWGYDQFVSRDTVISFVGVNNGPITELSVSEIQRNSKYFGKFYNARIESYWYYLTGIILLISLALGYSLIKKKKKKGLDFPFTHLEKKLLLKLLELTPGEYLTTHDINDILETSNKTQENQRRIRFNVISQINKKLQLKLGVKYGIERTSLPEDKRLTVYGLNAEIVNKVRDLFG